MSISPARSAAFDILLRVEREDAYASDLLHSVYCSELSPADHRLATELVMGVLRWRSMLDQSIGEVSSQPLHKLDTEVLTALRMGAYQLGWLDRIPARAALHDTVELVKRARKRSAAPFVNAVLRKLAARPAAAARTDQVETANNPNDIACLFAHPEWLVERWCSQFGIDTARRVCAHDQSVPTTSIRLRDPCAEDELRHAGIELAPGALLSGARRVVSGDVTRTKWFDEGRITIQDEASQLVAALVGKGSRILDCCAAPGGKTWAVADRNPAATVVAVELHPHRAQSLRKRVDANNVEVIAADVRKLPPSEAFDRVLADVPCSGTGTLARNPEIKWRLSPGDLADVRSRQLSILQAAMKHVTPSGVLLYSTCSLEQEEDESVIEEALRSDSSFRLLECRSQLERLRGESELVEENVGSLLSGPYLRTIPGVHRCDGFFVAMLKKKG